MNGLAWAAVLCVAAWGATAEHPSQKPVTVHMVAVRASGEGKAPKKFDDGLEDIRKAISELPYNSFKLVTTATRSAPYNKESKLDITPKCSLYVTPVAKQDDGRIKLTIRIEAIEEKSQKPFNALRSTAVVVPDEKFKYRLKMDTAELVVVVSVTE